MGGSATYRPSHSWLFLLKPLLAGCGIVTEEGAYDGNGKMACPRTACGHPVCARLLGFGRHLAAGNVFRPALAPIYLK